MNLPFLIKSNYAGLVDLCRAHNVDKLYLFGSAATDQFNSDKSDIDLLVTLDISNPVDRGEALLSLWDKFESLFNRKVDLLTETSIKNPFLKNSINRTKKLIYDREREKISV